MSIELHVYGPAATLLAPSDLMDDAQTVNWDLTLVRDSRTLEPAPKTDTCIVLGWPSDADHREGLAAALKARDSGAVAAFYRGNALGIVELDAEHPYTPDASDIAEWERLGTPATHLARVRDARVRYTLRTNASRNDLSAELQHQLWLLLGVLTDGLCEDPERGTFIDAADDSEIV